MNKISLKLSILLVFDVFSAMTAYMFLGMTATVMNNLPYFIISLAVAIIFLVLTVGCVIKEYINGDELYYVNIKILAVSLVISIVGSVFLYKRITDFSFEKWQSNESLRPFIVTDLCESQGPSDNKKEEYNLNRYTREEVKELLSINSEKDISDKFIFKFETPGYTFGGEEYRFIADTYFAYNGIDFKDYWIVVMYVEDLQTGQYRLSRVEVMPEGTHTYQLHG